MSQVTCIIPAAGSGTRMGSPPHGKELMTDPVTQEPLINWSIKLALDAGHRVVVPVLFNKHGLISYLIHTFGKRINLQILMEQPTEWPGTILGARKYWGSKNLLLLPDVRFKPTSIVTKLPSLLEPKKVGIAFATHEVGDPSLFGIVDMDEEHGIAYVSEKPRRSDCYTAWGLIAFDNLAGPKLFRTYLEPGTWGTTERVATVKLESFIDITRTGKVLSY